MSELVSNYPRRQTRLVQHRRRRLPKAVRGNPARAVKCRSPACRVFLGSRRPPRELENTGSSSLTPRAHRLCRSPTAQEGRTRIRRPARVLVSLRTNRSASRTGFVARAPYLTASPKVPEMTDRHSFAVGAPAKFDTVLRKRSSRGGAISLPDSSGAGRGDRRCGHDSIRRSVTPEGRAHLGRCWQPSGQDDFLVHDEPGGRHHPYPTMAG